MTKSNLLVFGATGSIGAYIISAILASRDAFNRVVVFTSPNTLSTKSAELDALRAKGAEIISGDLTNRDDIIKAYEGIDTVVSALGRAVIAAQIPLIELADATPHIKRFVPSEYGTDIEYSPASQYEKPHQLKLKVRAALSKTTNLEYAYIVTGPYADVPFYLGPSARGGTFDLAAKKAVLLGDGNGKISLSTCPDVGKFVVDALTHWDAAKGRALKLNSFTTTPAEILAEYEKQSGAKWEVGYSPLDEMKAMEKEAWEKGQPDATALTLRRIWTEGGTLYSRRDNDDIGAENTMSLSDAVRDAIKAQGGI